MTLRNKLFILFLSVSLIPFWAIGIGIYFLVEDNILNVSTNLTSEIATRKESQLTEILRKDINNLPSIKADEELNSLLAKYPAWTLVEQDKVNKLLGESITVDSTFEKIYILDQDGIVAGSTDGGLVGEDYSLEEFFNRGVKSLTTSVFGKNEEGEIIRYYAAPISIGGTSIGTVVAEARTEEMQRIVLDSTGLGETGESYVIRAENSGGIKFITHTRFDSDAALKRVIPGGIENSLEWTALYEGSEGVFDLEDYRGERVIASAKEISGATLMDGRGFLKLVVKKDVSEVIAPLNRIRVIFFGGTLVLTLVLLVIAAIFIKSAIKPIHLLAMAARKISEGDLSQTVEIKSKDELGQLASTFNMMSANLSERSVELNKKTEDLKQKVGELAKAREEAEGERARDEEILRSIGDGLVVIDKSGSIKMASRIFGEMLGLDADKIIGLNWLDVISLKYENGDTVPLEKTPIAQVFSSGSRVSTAPITEKRARLYIALRAGKKIPVQITASPIMAGNSASAVVAIFRNVVREIETERSKTEFVAVASHKLRTPLSAVKWYLEILLADDIKNLRAEQLDSLQEVGRGNQRMIDLVDALLNTSRIELGEFSLRPAQVEIKPVIKEIIGEMQRAIAENGLILTEHYDDDLPRLETDKDLFSVVIKNLLSNAVKYSDKNIGVEISAQKINKERPDSESNRAILIKIYDDGIGIPESARDYVFTKLFRADNAKLRDPEGSGLGLYMTKSIIDQTGGRIWFESKENEGSTFNVLVPAKWRQEME